MASITRVGGALALLCVAAGGGRAARFGVDYLNDEKHFLLETGVAIPDAQISDDHGTVSLVATLQRERPNALVILSSKCTTLLGELAGWRDATAENTDVRPLVLIANADSGQVAYARKLLKSPPYRIFRIAENTLPIVGAKAVPVVYLLDSDGRVKKSGIGVKATLTLRDDLIQELRH